jgi:O-glycosyl hydrolase
MFFRQRRFVVTLCALCACVLAAPAFALDVTISTTRNQTIYGFGTCIAWWITSPYDQDAWRTMYAQDMGCSLLRVELGDGWRERLRRTLEQVADHNSSREPSEVS